MQFITSLCFYGISLPGGGSGVPVNVLPLHKNSTSQNQQRMNSTRHNKWSFPTLPFLAARSLWGKTSPSLPNLLVLTLSSQYPTYKLPLSLLLNEGFWNEEEKMQSWHFIWDYKKVLCHNCIMPWQLIHWKAPFTLLFALSVLVVPLEAAASWLGPSLGAGLCRLGGRAALKRWHMLYSIGCTKN